MVFLFVAIIQGVPEKMFVCEINMINMYELLIFFGFSERHEIWDLQTPFFIEK